MGEIICSPVAKMVLQLFNAGFGLQPSEHWAGETGIGIDDVDIPMGGLKFFSGSFKV